MNVHNKTVTDSSLTPFPILNTLVRIGKGVCQGCVLSPYLFTYTRSTSCKMPGCMNHKLKSRLNHKLKSKLNFQKTKIMAFGPITLWKIDMENVETQ